MKRRHVVMLIAVIVLWLIASLRGGRHASGSTFSSRGEGAEALFLVLRELGLRVEHWYQPFSELARARRGETLFVIDPGAIEPQSGKRLFEWVGAGNRLVFMGMPQAYQRLVQGGEDKEQDADWQATARRVLELPALGTGIRCQDAPEAVCRGVTRISELERAFPPIPDAAVLAASAAGPTVLFRRVDQGEVWLFSESLPALNDHLDRFDNLRLLYQIASRGRGRILFDEFHHGYTAPAEGERALQSASLVVLIAYLLALLVVGALSRAVRFGPPRVRPVEQAAAAAEFASVLGLLYRDHGASSVLRYYVRAWRRRLEQALGLNARLSDERLVEALQVRGTVSGAAAPRLAGALRRLGAEAALSEQEVAALSASVEGVLDGKMEANQP